VSVCCQLQTVACGKVDHERLRNLRVTTVILLCSFCRIRYSKLVFIWYTKYHYIPSFTIISPAYLRPQNMAGTPGEDSSDFRYDRDNKLPLNVSICYHLHGFVGIKNSVLIMTSAMADILVVLRTCLHILYFAHIYLRIACDFHIKQHCSYDLYIRYSVNCNSITKFKPKNAQNFIKITVII